MCLCVKVTNRKENNFCHFASYSSLSLLFSFDILSRAFRPRQNTKFTPQSILIHRKAAAKKKEKKKNTQNNRFFSLLDLLYLLVHFTFRNFAIFKSLQFPVEIIYSLRHKFLSIEGDYTLFIYLSITLSPSLSKLDSSLVFSHYYTSNRYHKVVIVHLNTWSAAELSDFELFHSS